MTAEPSPPHAGGLATRFTADGVFIEELPRPELAVALNLEPHPEGGWYRRTWTSPVSVRLVDAGIVRERPAATIILFLLPPQEFSAWHRVASEETWIWNGLAPIVLEFGGTGRAPLREDSRILGGDGSAGQHHQVTIPTGVWQRTLPGDSTALASCVVSPGFDFADFMLEQASPPDTPGD